jgi:hypothetical protein
MRAKRAKERGVFYEDVNLIEGIIGSVIAAALVAMVVAIYRRQFGQRITITEPLNHGSLSPTERHFGVLSHPVYGTIRNLPKGHKIWLIVADEAGGKFWPQTFSPVEADEAKGTWKGYIHAWGWHSITRSMHTGTG